MGLSIQYNFSSPKVGRPQAPLLCTRFGGQAGPHGARKGATEESPTPLGPFYGDAGGP